MNVLIAVDGSPTSRQAIEFAYSLLAGQQVSVLLFHVIPQHLIYGKGGAAPAEVYDLPKERTASRELLDECAQQLQAAGVDLTVETRVGIGDPAELILSAAADNDADLIVLGSRGLSAAQRFLIGSVSTKVVTHAHCPVLVVRPKTLVAE